MVSSGHYTFGGKSYALAPGVQTTLENFFDSVELVFDKMPDDSVEAIKKLKLDKSNFLLSLLKLPFETVRFITKNLHIFTASMVIPLDDENYNINSLRADIREKMPFSVVAKVWADFFSQSDIHFLWLLIQAIFPIVITIRKAIIKALLEMTKKTQ